MHTHRILLLVKLSVFTRVPPPLPIPAPSPTPCSGPAPPPLPAHFNRPAVTNDKNVQINYLELLYENLNAFVNNATYLLFKKKKELES